MMNTTARSNAHASWIRPHVDRVGVWFRRETPADDPKARARRARRVTAEVLRHHDSRGPSPLYPTNQRTGAVDDRFGVGFSFSAAPLWGVPIDLEARAAGERMPELEERHRHACKRREERLAVALGAGVPDLWTLLRTIEALEGRVTRLELAVDVVGPSELDAEAVAREVFPSAFARQRRTDDLFRLDRAVHLEPGRWRSTLACRYQANANSPRNLVAYFDRPSKLRGEHDEPVFRFEVRVKGTHLPDELRQPTALLRLIQPEAVLRLIARHVIVNPRALKQTV